mgnify:CR=1 FL=1
MLKKLTAINLALLLMVMGYLLFQQVSTPEIAYVRTAEIVAQYKGMQEAQMEFDRKVATLQQQSDTLYSLALNLSNRLKQNSKRLTASEVKTLEMELARRNQEWQQFRQSMQAQMEAEEMKLLGGAIMQINSFVANYGKDKGFEIILGTTEDGNLMYANEGIDITQEVILALNKTHQL